MDHLEYLFQWLNLHLSGAKSGQHIFIRGHYSHTAIPKLLTPGYFCGNVDLLWSFEILIDLIETD